MIRKVKRAGEYTIARLPLAKSFYWSMAPTYYRKKIRNRIDHDAPLDPLKIVCVNPSNISRITGRQNASVERYRSLGRVLEGDWDTRTPDQNGWEEDVLEETLLYESFVERFTEAAEWGDTPLVEHFSNEPRAMHNAGYDNETELIQDLRNYDDLYRAIRDEGYKSQRELQEIGLVKRDRVGLLDRLTDEITVDIGRDGGLLFVDGRHRLSIAKILELPAVPIVILVRHPRWLDRRNELYRVEQKPDRAHPDTAEFNEEIEQLPIV